MSASSAFFDAIRPLFGGRLRQEQVDGINAIVSTFWQTFPNGDRRWLAYELATAHLETAQTMQPIRERGSNEYFRRRYDITGEKPEIAARLGNTQPGDGVKFCGRGYVQLTGRANYARATRELGIDFVGSPDLVMEPEHAAVIMHRGMSEGWFTGKSLSDYFRAGREDWRNARRIINGLDKAADIAATARAFNKALGG